MYTVEVVVNNITSKQIRVVIRRQSINVHFNMLVLRFKLLRNLYA